MAVIDPRSGALVIRVVYDGGPGAGKTTSLRTLAARLGVNVEAPREVNGRTVFFDWVDYTGGLFEGRQIRCQIISVPGQASLAPRRAHLLRGADVVIFVGDTSPEGYPSLDRYLHGLLVLLRSIPGPTIGVVLQANKRDHLGAAPLESLRDFRNGEARLAVFESVATDGAGIREAFVFAVRLALDRVRDLMASGKLLHGPPEIDTSGELLAHLKLIEGDQLQMAVDDGLVHTRLASLRSAPIDSSNRSSGPSAPRAASAPHISEHPVGTAAPRTSELPTSEVPSGLVWPPIEGRIMLHHATAEPPGSVQRSDAEYSCVGASGWIFYSASQAIFPDLNSARAALVAWARAHVCHLDIITEQRCVVVVQDREHFRLWQVIRTCRNLSDEVREAAHHGGSQFALTVAEAAAGFARAASLFANDARSLPLRLEWVSAGATGPRYSGPMPYLPTAPDDAPYRDVLAEFWHQVRASLQEARTANDQLADLIEDLAKAGVDRALSTALRPLHGGACV
jgi:signal recognition particle receptor subunit beta